MTWRNWKHSILSLPSSHTIVELVGQVYTMLPNLPTCLLRWVVPVPRFLSCSHLILCACLFPCLRPMLPSHSHQATCTHKNYLLAPEALDNTDVRAILLDARHLLPADTENTQHAKQPAMTNLWSSICVGTQASN